MPAILITTTTATKEEAQRIAEALISGSLAACVQISGPISSLYTWKGKREESQEFRLSIKTKASLYPQVEAKIGELHSYEVPEIVACPIERGLKEYLQWIAEETLP